MTPNVDVEKASEVEMPAIGDKLKRMMNSRLYTPILNGLTPVLRSVIAAQHG